MPLFRLWNGILTQGRTCVPAGMVYWPKDVPVFRLEWYTDPRAYLCPGWNGRLTQGRTCVPAGMVYWPKDVVSAAKIKVLVITFGLAFVQKYCNQPFFICLPVCIFACFSFLSASLYLWCPCYSRKRIPQISLIWGSFIENPFNLRLILDGSSKYYWICCLSHIVWPKIDILFTKDPRPNYSVFTIFEYDQRSYTYLYKNWTHFFEHEESNVITKDTYLRWGAAKIAYVTVEKQDILVLVRTFKIHFLQKPYISHTYML